MKLFPVKCHERATLRKLWGQTGNSSLLPAECWPLLLVIAGILAQFSNFAFVLFCYVTNHLITGPLGNSEFCFPRISMFPSISSRETLRFSGNEIYCSPRDQSLSDNLQTKGCSRILLPLIHGLTGNTSGHFTLVVIPKYYTTRRISATVICRASTKTFH